MKLNITVTDELTADARAIREEVFMREQGYLDEFDAVDLRSKHLVLYADGNPVGCCRFFAGKRPGEWVLGRLAVLMSMRRRGMARAIIAAALENVKKLGAESVYLDAQEYVQGLYRKFGFVPCGAVFLEEGNPHVPMRMELK